MKKAGSGVSCSAPGFYLMDVKEEKGKQFEIKTYT